MVATIVETFDNVSIKAMAFKFKGDESATVADCTASLSGETELQEIVKKCGATEVKKKTKPIKLTLTISGHMPMSVYRNFYGLEQLAETKKGVYSYGPTSSGKPFSLAVEVGDDFEETSKLMGFLECSSNTGLTFSIENGADEVAPFELEASVMLDELKQFYHEAIVQELETDITDDWMNKLSVDVVKKTVVAPASAPIKK